MGRFEDFKRDCLENDEVICDKDELKSYLDDKTVGNNWWELNDTQRENLGGKIIEWWTFPLRTIQWRFGEKNCEGPTSGLEKTGCSFNAIVRYALLGRCRTVISNGEEKTEDYIAGRDDEYYCTEWDYAKHRMDCNWKCFFKPIGDRWDMPVFLTHAGIYAHTVCALQIKNKKDELTSWLFFNYEEIIEPGGGSQIPGGVTITIHYQYYTSKTGEPLGEDIRIYVPDTHNSKTVFFFSEPEYEELYVDGIFWEYTTAELAFGKHTIRFVLTGYNDLECVIDVQKEGVTCVSVKDGTCGSETPPGVTLPVSYAVMAWLLEKGKTPIPTPSPQIKEYLKCLFPRIFTGNSMPRITTSDPTPRITCLVKIKAKL